MDQQCNMLMAGDRVKIPRTNLFIREIWDMKCTIKVITKDEIILIFDSPPINSNALIEFFFIFNEKYLNAMEFIEE